MKRFHSALHAALAKTEGSATTLAAAIGYAPPSITRVLRGERVASNQLVADICKHFASRPSIAYELLVSHLYDVAEQSGLNLGSLTIASAATRTADSDRWALLIEEAQRVPELRALLEDLLMLTMRYKAQIVAAGRGAIYPFPDIPSRAVAERAVKSLPRGRAQEPAG